jgi:hypothetical protein
MRECIIVILLVLCRISAIAQSDVFFIYGEGVRYIKKDDEYKMILLPEQHGLECNYSADAASLETGCMLLLGMSLLYTKVKKRNMF